MTPKFAQAADPVFLHVLDLLERISQDEKVSAQEERMQIRVLLDQAEAIVGSGPDWELAKYALVSWIDEMLVDSPWEGREWWGNNVLEVELFNTRLCNEQFYIRAQEASSLPGRDTLEVFYVCVVLGFRGLYRDVAFAATMIQMHGLPNDLEAWAKQTSMSIRLGQGRPPMAGPQRDITGAPPRRMKPLVVWSWLSTAMLSVVCVVYYFFAFIIS